LSGYFASRRDDSTFLTDASFGPSLLLPNHDLAAGFQKLDFTAGYRFGPHLAAYSVIENLLSQHYEPVFGFPAAPLTFRTGVKLTVGGDSRGLP
jgi:iron complex outermembrane receptor protein/vitamin B12 transporter